MSGTAEIPAAKNSVLPLLAASVMCSGPVQFRRVPPLADVQASAELLRGLGFAVQQDPERLTVTAGSCLTGQVPEGPARAMRSSVFYLAPLLHRLGWVSMPMPGGCDLGPRPIDIHLDGLVHMGAQVCWEYSTLTVRAAHRLRGMDYTLRLPSVGATETLLMAASRAVGTTVLRGAACEPEVQDLAAFLRACGAHITGDGTPVIVVRGVEELGGVRYTPMPDRIAAATVACAVAAAGGHALLRSCIPEHFAPVLEFLQRLGCSWEPREDGLCIERTGRLRGGIRICTGAYPGFPTDAAPLAAAVLLTAAGESTICDTIFEHRFACAEGFEAMGAQTRCEGRTLHICGVQGLRGADVTAPDLRGGAALILAALAARGESRIGGLEHIRRGYSDPEQLLRALGADAKMIRTDSPF